MAKKILITGGNGFIGRHVCEELSRLGMDFLALTHGADNFSWPCVDISIDDRAALEKVIKNYKPDAILHLAAIALVTHDDTSEIYRTNVCGTENLLETVRAACEPGTRVILASTAGVYGNQGCEFLEEKDPFNPANHYSYSKMVMEYMSRFYVDRLDIVIVRPFNVIGVGQNSLFLVPKLVSGFVKRQETLAVGNTTSVRDYVNVEYCSAVLTKLLMDEKTPKILNICTGQGHSCNDIIEMLKEITGCSPKIEIADTFVRSNEVWRLVGSKERLNTFMGGSVTPEPLFRILQGMVEDQRTAD